jgi:hypothetical protein
MKIESTTAIQKRGHHLANGDKDLIKNTTLVSPNKQYHVIKV